MKRIVSLAILMIVLLMAAACGGAKEPAASATEAPAAAADAGAQQQQPAAATQAPATATPIPPTATPEPEEEEEVQLNEDQLAALEKLESYRLVINFSSKGEDAEGNAIDDHGEIITEFNRADDARHMVMTFVDNTDPTASQPPVEVFQIGTEMLMFAGEDVGWMRISTEDSPFSDPDLTMMTSGDVFSDLENMRRVRPDEKISGIDSRHYQFDEASVLTKLFEADMENVKASGDVWIAKDGGFVTKYTMVIEVDGGTGGMFDPTMTKGTMTMDFELQDVNSDIAIELPEEALAGATMTGFDGAVPMPEDASIQASSANFAILSSALPVAEVVAFYDEALTELGWTKDESGSMSMGDMASLSFSKDGVTLSLIVSLDSSTCKTQIMANVE